MNSHNDDNNLSPRQAYRKPELSVYGSVSRLTQLNLTMGSQDNPTNVNGKTQSAE